MVEEIKVKEVQASYTGSKNYNSVTIGMTAEITKLMDADSAATTLLGKCMNIVSKKLAEMSDDKPEATTTATPKQSEHGCIECSKPITEKVSSYSKKFYGKSLCMDCQKTAKKVEQ